jgi:hypothetical protein
MTKQVRQQVRDYLLGVLDEAEMADVCARLESDPAYRRALRVAQSEIDRLRCVQSDTEVPRGLARRTCNVVFDPVQRLRLSKLRRRCMTPIAVVPGPTHGRGNWIDLTVICVICGIAGLLIVPAINGSRFHARVTACQENMRHVGQALAEHSHRNHEIFPTVPAAGNLAADGIWAPVLQDEGLLIEPQSVLCPESPLAAQQDFQIPSLEELRRAAGHQLADIQQKMGGSYGYCLGYLAGGILQPTRNSNRDYFAILADAPSGRLDHQSPNHDFLGQNVLFEDMHVEFCSSTRPGEGRDDIFTNDLHEVAPGLHRDDSVIASSGTSPIDVNIRLP